jgi:hypothetical protein
MPPPTVIACRYTAVVWEDGSKIGLASTMGPESTVEPAETAFAVSDSVQPAELAVNPA